MLSEFIQLKVVKSQTQFQRAVPLKFNNAKFSLQIPKINVFRQFQTTQLKKSQGLINFNHSQQSLNPKYQNTKFYEGERIYTNRFKYNNQYCLNQQKPFDTLKQQMAKQASLRSRIPLIVSPNKQIDIRKKKLNKSNRPSLILSPQKIDACKRSLRSQESSRFGISSINLRSPIIKYSKQNVLVNNRQSFQAREQSNDKRYLFKSVNHQNLSPLKQKQYKILSFPDLAKQVVGKKQKCSKPNLNRSNSFKRAIELSKQKSNRNEQSPIKQRNCETKTNKIILNQDYYDSNANKNNAENKQNLPFNSKIKMKFVKNQRIIKSPEKKTTISKKKNQLSNINLNKINQNQRCQQNSSAKKTDQFFDPIVNNSSMKSLMIEDSKVLNMEPF